MLTRAEINAYMHAATPSRDRATPHPESAEECPYTQCHVTPSPLFVAVCTLWLSLLGGALGFVGLQVWGAWAGR